MSELLEHRRLSVDPRNGRKELDDHLEMQLVNELRAVLQPINEKYKGFFHINLITLCNMKDMMCDECREGIDGQQCKRCVIGFQELGK